MGGFTCREKKLDRDDQENRKSDEMRIEDFRKLIILAAKHNFPDASILLAEKRGITLEAKVKISEKVFVEVYYNSLTDKKSFALIKDNQRILGYDNYKYWHIHPRNNVTSHVPCQEPSIEKVFEEIKEIILSL
ncbi:MAG: hypothetical protein ABII96_02140 [Candidatus Zixiibacteriota bacterium]